MAQQGNDEAIRRQNLKGTIVEDSFAGITSFMRRKYTKELAGVDVAIVGVPFDLATSNRPGARFGPRAIRAESAQLAWGPQWPWGFDPFDYLSVIDYGDTPFDHARPEKIPAQITAAVRPIVQSGAFMLSLGGDHFASLPLLRAMAEKHGALSLIHFDAHSDTDDSDPGTLDHGKMFFEAHREGIIDTKHSVQIGLRTYHESLKHGFTVLDAQYVHAHGVAKVLSEIKRVVGNRPAYLSFDIDCLDPAFAPGTGTPVPGGLSSHQALEIIRGLGEFDIRGMDVMEVAPAYDAAAITALAGAQIALEYLCVLADKRRPK